MHKCEILKKRDIAIEFQSQSKVHFHCQRYFYLVIRTEQHISILCKIPHSFSFHIICYSTYEFLFTYNCVHKLFNFN